MTVCEVCGVFISATDMDKERWVGGDGDDGAMGAQRAGMRMTQGGR